MPIKIPQYGTIRAFVMLVDINRFAEMVSKAGGDLIAQFTRDVLGGAITNIEKEEGEVVGFMGDAILAVFEDGDHTAKACFGIAHDLDRQCEYISIHQKEFSRDWEFAPGGPSIKISIEYGALDVSTIISRALGEQRLLVGHAINYASRINSAGEGNRCNVGPVAAKMEGLSCYDLAGPFTVQGKHSEPDYQFYDFDLGDIWIAGVREPGARTYWG